MEIAVTEYRNLVETSAKFDMLIQHLMDEASLNVDKNGLTFFLANDKVIKLVAPEDYWDRFDDLKGAKK